MWFGVFCVCTKELGFCHFISDLFLSVEHFFFSTVFVPIRIQMRCMQSQFVGWTHARKKGLIFCTRFCFFWKESNGVSKSDSQHCLLWAIVIGKAWTILRKYQRRSKSWDRVTAKIRRKFALSLSWSSLATRVLENGRNFITSFNLLFGWRCMRLGSCVYPSISCIVIVATVDWWLVYHRLLCSLLG